MTFDELSAIKGQYALFVLDSESWVIGLVVDVSYGGHNISIQFHDHRYSFQDGWLRQLQWYNYYPRETELLRTFDTQEEALNAAERLDEAWRAREQIIQKANQNFSILLRLV